MTTNIGSYIVGEAPQGDLTYQFLDSAGDPYDLTLYSDAQFIADTPSRSSLSKPATIVDAATGTVSVGWSTDYTTEVGVWTGIFHLTPGPIKSVILRWSVIPGPGGYTVSNQILTPTIIVG